MNTCRKCGKEILNNGPGWFHRNDPNPFVIPHIAELAGQMDTSEELNEWLPLDEAERAVNEWLAKNCKNGPPGHVLARIYAAGYKQGRLDERGAEG